MPDEGTSAGEGDDAPLTAERASELAARFHAEHERVYGTSAPGEPVELVGLRLGAVGLIARPRPRPLPPGPADPSTALRLRRPVFFAEAGGWADCPIYDRYRLLAGVAIAGPAIVEELDSTTVIHPGQRAVVDGHGALLISVAAEGVSQ